MHATGDNGQCFQDFLPSCPATSDTRSELESLRDNIQGRIVSQRRVSLLSNKILPGILPLLFSTPTVYLHSVKTSQSWLFNAIRPANQKASSAKLSSPVSSMCIYLFIRLAALQHCVHSSEGQFLERSFSFLKTLLLLVFALFTALHSCLCNQVYRDRPVRRTWCSLILVQHLWYINPTLTSLWKYLALVEETKNKEVWGEQFTAVKCLYNRLWVMKLNRTWLQ